MKNKYRMIKKIMLLDIIYRNQSSKNAEWFFIYAGKTVKESVPKCSIIF